MSTKDRFEPWLVGGIAAVAVFQLVHALEAETDRAFGAVDFPAVVIFMTGCKTGGFESAVSAFADAFSSREFCKEGGGIIDGDFFHPFAGGSFQAESLSFFGTLFNEGFLQADG